MAEYGKECRLHARHFRSANFSAYRRVDPISSQEAGDAAKKKSSLGGFSARNRWTGIIITTCRFTFATIDVMHNWNRRHRGNAVADWGDGASLGSGIMRPHLLKLVVGLCVVHGGNNSRRLRAGDALETWSGWCPSFDENAGSIGSKIWF